MRALSKKPGGGIVTPLALIAKRQLMGKLGAHVLWRVLAVLHGMSRAIRNQAKSSLSAGRLSPAA